MPNVRRILLAEDDPNDVELTLKALAHHNLTNGVDVVHDGAEALDYLYCRGAFAERAKAPPAVILLDIKMPKVDGVEVLRQLKADAQLRVVPVVMLTSSRQERDVMESYRLGVNAYVVKPMDFHDFITVVQELGLFWAVINEPAPAANCGSA